MVLNQDGSVQLQLAETEIGQGADTAFSQMAADELSIPLEKVRGVLAEKSRDGYTAEVRAIIQSFGADRLSEIDPSQYEAVLKKAEVLGNG